MRTGYAAPRTWYAYQCSLGREIVDCSYENVNYCTNGLSAVRGKETGDKIDEDRRDGEGGKFNVGKIGLKKKQIKCKLCV